MFNLDQFISDRVICRSASMFLKDLCERQEEIAAQIGGRSILVIGGAGSIGSSFIRALIDYRPKSLVVADINENALAELTRGLRAGGYFVPKDYVPYPMSYTSPTFARMFRARGGFDVVANFAAHKHVRSEKDMYSVAEMLQNNVLNVRNLMALLEEFPPESYFCVSTDKAANPVNLMGASKRLMEDLIFSYANRFPVKTARFANVAFSNGSLLDSFLHRISALEPLTAPTDVKRYFVSPEESGQICLLAAATANSGEILFPKFDEAQMTSFDKIAEDLLAASGYEPLYCDSDAEAVACESSLRKGGKKYPVHFSVSDTSGEKLVEEFYTSKEEIDMTRYAALGVVTGKREENYERLAGFLDGLAAMLEDPAGNKEELIHFIGHYLPDFAHIEKGKNLDSKM